MYAYIHAYTHTHGAHTNVYLYLHGRNGRYAHGKVYGQNVPKYPSIFRNKYLDVHSLYKLKELHGKENEREYLNARNYKGRIITSVLTSPKSSMWSMKPTNICVCVCVCVCVYSLVACLRSETTQIEGEKVRLDMLMHPYCA